jgi:hypothetical protein
VRSTQAEQAFFMQKNSLAFAREIGIIAPIKPIPTACNFHTEEVADSLQNTSNCTHENAFEDDYELVI